MKKLLLLSLIVLFSVSVSSQNENHRHPVYCNVMGYNFWGVGKVKVELDMGRYTNSKGFDSLYEADGKKKKFNTMMSVLNFMGELGWKCIGTYYLTEGSTNVVHYLMEKWVESEEEITMGLILKEDTEQKVEKNPKSKKNKDDMYK